MIKSQLPTNMFGVPCSMPIGDAHGNKAQFLGAGSKVVREELQELAAKVCTSDKLPVKKKVFVNSKGSRKANRNSINKSKNSTLFQDQELLKEKDLVMGMIQTATANMQPDSQTCGKSMGDQLHSQAGLGLLSRDEYHQMKNMNSFMP
ncbi:hypothetical protein XELAEV_18000686mg [Xenopus laevis]|nr:hypothetical protein XELAEV_18000686mg [Xenopus laevis]